jgi:opacity protein-like surface antigen
MNKFISMLALACVLIMSTNGLAGTNVAVENCCADVEAQVQNANSNIAKQNEAIVANATTIVEMQEVLANKEDKMFSPWYVSVNAGMSFPLASEVGTIEDGIKYDDGFVAGISVGRVFNNFRAEVALNYEESDVAEDSLAVPVEGDAVFTNLMANAYYTYPVTDAFGIYVMGGVGVAQYSLSAATVDDDDTVFAANVGAGVSYMVTEAIAVDAGYKYTTTSDAIIDNTAVTYASNEVLVGVRFMF